MNAKAEDIMTRNVVTVFTKSTLQDLVEIFFSKKVSGVPVVDENSMLVGIISKTDLVTHGLEKELHSIMGQKMSGSSSIDLPDFDNLLGPEPSSATVEGIMTTPVITAKPSTGISEIVGIMLKNKIHRVIIINNGKVEGIVTSMDLLRLLDKK